MQTLADGPIDRLDVFHVREVSTLHIQPADQSPQSKVHLAGSGNFVTLN